MTMTRPLRRITLHLSQIFLTLGFTFMIRLLAVLVPAECRGPLLSSSALLVAVDDAAARQVVWAQLHDDLVLREDSDVVLTHLARDVGENAVSVGQLNAKHRVGQRLDYCAFDL